MKFLLDVNVLLAAIWTTHTQHGSAARWLEDKAVVLCPITELGFIRISTNKKAINVKMEKAREALDKFMADLNAESIPDDLPALHSHPRSSEQVTDHYLADLAAKHGFRLATLDVQLKHPFAELVC